MSKEAATYRFEADLLERFRSRCKTDNVDQTFVIATLLEKWLAGGDGAVEAWISEAAGKRQEYEGWDKVMEAMRHDEPRRTLSELAAFYLSKIDREKL